MKKKELVERKQVLQEQLRMLKITLGANGSKQAKKMSKEYTEMACEAAEIEYKLINTGNQEKIEHIRGKQHFNSQLNECIKKMFSHKEWRNIIKRVNSQIEKHSKYLGDKNSDMKMLDSFELDNHRILSPDENNEYLESIGYKWKYEELEKRIALFIRLIDDMYKNPDNESDERKRLMQVNQNLAISSLKRLAQKVLHKDFRESLKHG
jgi:hypothetical protein